MFNFCNVVIPRRIRKSVIFGSFEKHMCKMFALNQQFARYARIQNVLQVRAASKLAQVYEPEKVEKVWLNHKTRDVFEQEEKHGTFHMILPPPNVTGKLHLGHALNAVVQDVICRRQRQMGYNVEWIPGTDHAGIATQALVEKKLLHERALNRREIGREAFLQEIWKWKNASANNIIEDLKKLGCTLDWDKEYFTMDKQQSKAVALAFTALFDRQLIKRQRALVNWSCALQSAISDIEVDMLEIKEATDLSVPGYDKPVRFGELYDIRYKVLNPSGKQDEFITVSTTRPETLLGDVAVAVHPADERYAKYRELANVQLWHPFRAEPIPLVFDIAVDPDFGSGAVKLTPAHDRLDFDIAERHLLPMLNVFTKQGCVASDFKQFADMPRFKARAAILEALAKMQLLADSKAHCMKLPICSRSGDVIEYLLLEQWFVKSEKLAKAAASAVRSGRLQIRPSNFEVEWLRWLEDCHDWCISRQLWWGHQIPAYKAETADGKCCWVAATNDEDARQKAIEQLEAEPISLVRDEDVLDTWFSSALLPFSIHNWPNKEYQQKYPLDLLQTGHDILFFWVARMVMLGLELTDRLPFERVLLNGIICDAHGRKMSKSLGNIVTPQQIVQGCTLQSMENDLKQSHAEGILSAAEMKKSSKGLRQMFPQGIPACGTDALRFTLCSQNIRHHFINFNVNECHMNKLFFNKIWQVTRYTLGAAESLQMLLDTIQTLDYVPLGIFDAWIVSRLEHTMQICENAYKTYNFHLATAALKNFLYSNLCDVYVETTKANVHSHCTLAFVHVATLVTCITGALQALSPIAPHIANELMQHLPDDIELRLDDYRREDLELEVNEVLKICQCIRQVKSRNKISKKHEPQVLLLTENDDAHQMLEQHLEAIQALTLTNGVELLAANELQLQSENNMELGVTSTAGHLCKFVIKTNSLYDKDCQQLLLETRKLNEKKLRQLEAELNSYRLRMENAGFRKNVTEQLQQKHKEKIQQLEAEILNIKSLVGK